MDSCYTADKITGDHVYLMHIEITTCYNTGPQQMYSPRMVRRDHWGLKTAYFVIYLYTIYLLKCPQATFLHESSSFKIINENRLAR